MYEGKERRLHPRYAAPESLEAVAFFPTKPDQRLQLKDISLGGFSFVTETDISGENYFSVSLREVESARTLLRIDVSARIAWHVRDDATSVHAAGVQFADLTESDREALERLIATLRPIE